MKLDQFLCRSSELHPERIAVVDENRSITYRELSAAAARLAEHLRGFQLSNGSRIALLMENSVEYTIAYFAVLQSDYVVVPLDTSISGESLRYILENCGVKILIAQSRFRRKLKELFDQRCTVELLLSDSSLNLGELAPPIAVYDQFMAIESYKPSFAAPTLPADEELSIVRNGKRHDLAAIFYTSGSTGSSKGVMLSHLNLISNTLATVEYLRLTKEDRTLVILPFYYIYGNSLLLTAIACGACLVIDNRFMYPETVLNTLEEQKCTGFSGVPSNFMILLGKSTLASRKLPHLRYFTQAGGAMAPEVIRSLVQAFPDKEVFIMYGQTEAAPRVTYLPPPRLTDKLGSIGIPLSGIQVKIMDDQGQELPPGATGELVVAGDNVMMGYWRQPNEEREVLRDGQLCTGDLGYKDADGFLYIVGRKKEIIKAGGNRVSVKEVEECLLSNSKVLEACVVGVPDPFLGEAIKAVIVLKPGAHSDEREMLLHCRKALADFKVPKTINVVDSLPKYQSGKVNRPLLKQQLTGA